MSSSEEDILINSTVNNCLCTYPECNKPVVNRTIGLCPRCVYKITRFEERLDRWLSVFYSDLALTDVMGWYRKCSRDECRRECLDEDFYVQGCSCCPCFLELKYITNRIDNYIFPTEEWMQHLKEKIEKR